MTFILDVTGTVASPALIDDLLEPLLERHIPRGWIHGELTDPRATRAALEAAGRTGAAMEIIPHSVRIVDRRPFFRMHAAHIARQ